MFLDDREQSAGRSEENRRFVIRYFPNTYLFLHRLIRERMEEKLRKKKEDRRRDKKAMTYLITRVVKCRKSEGTAASCNAGMNARA